MENGVKETKPVKKKSGKKASADKNQKNETKSQTRKPRGNKLNKSKETGNSKKVDKKDALLIKFDIHISKEDISAGIRKLANEYLPKIKIPGFRKDKIPVDLVIKTHKNALSDEVTNKMISEYAFEKIKKDKIEIVSPPIILNIVHKEDEDLKAEIAVERFPEIKLPELSKIKVEIPKKELDEIEGFDEKKNIERLLEANQSPVQVTNKEISNKFLVQMSVQSKDLKTKRLSPKKIIPFRVNKDSEAEILDLYKEVIGKKLKDRIVIKRTYPEDYRKKAWAGKEIEHDILIEKAYEFRKPELDKEFLQKLGFKTEADLKERMKTEHEKRRKTDIENIKFNYLVNAMNKSSDFPLPNVLVENEISKIAGSKGQDPVKDIKQTTEPAEGIREEAEKNVRFSLILNDIKNKENINVAIDEIEAEYKKLAEINKIELKDIRKYYSDREKLEQLKNNLLNAKIMDFLKRTIKIKEV